MYNLQIGNKKYGRIIFCTLLICVISSILFNYIVYTGAILGTIAVSLLFLNIKQDERYVALMTLLPFASIFKLSATLPSGLFILYCIIIFFHVLKEPIKFINVLCLFTIGFLQLLSMVFYENTITNVVAILVNYCVMGILIQQLASRNYKESKCIFRATAVGFSLSIITEIIIAMIFKNLPYIIAYDKAVALENAKRFSALNADPNYFSQLILVAIGLLVPLLFESSERGNRKWFYGILIGLLAYYGYFSYSKSYIITVSVLVIMVYVAFAKKNFNTYAGFIISCCVLFLFVFTAGYLYQNVILPVFETRENALGLLTGRDSIWKEYIAYFYNYPESWILGMGSSNGMNVVTSNYAAHNAYLEIFGDIGIIGVICSIIYIVVNGVRVKPRIFEMYNIYIWMFMITAFALSVSKFDALYLLVPLLPCTYKLSDANDKIEV